MTVQRISDLDEFNRLEPEWNSLLQKSKSNSVFLTWEWVSTWWQFFGSESELFVLCVVDEHGRIDGIVPLKRQRRRIGGLRLNCLEFIGSGLETVPDYLDFILDPGCEEQASRLILEYLSRNKNSWDIIIFSDMREDSFCFRGFNHAVLSKTSSYEKEDICPYIELPKTWDLYLEALSKKSRYNVRKKRRNLDQDFKNEFL
ncbi:MAG: GNAT family N-acetyltransferase, partial [Candidatus Hodarchaeota archaeon]